MNFNYLIRRLRIKPFSKSRFSIHFCWLILLHVVRPIFEIDVHVLEIKFMNDYRKSERILYVSPYDKDEDTMDFRNANTCRKYLQSFNKLFKKIV